MDISTIIGIIVVLAILVGCYFLLVNVILPRMRGNGTGGTYGDRTDNKRR